MWSHDLGWWGFWIGILALILAFPLSMAANIMTPLFMNWFSKRTLSSLVKRIGILESRLAELEKTPAITEVENEILWGFQHLNITVLGVANGVIFIIFLAVELFADANNPKFTHFSGIMFAILTANLVMQMRLRYRNKFRELRSPAKRKALGETLVELKKLRDSWPAS